MVEDKDKKLLGKASTFKGRTKFIADIYKNCRIKVKVEQLMAHGLVRRRMFS